MRDKVFANLDSARDNGYFEKGAQLHGMSATEIASDMVAYAEDCQDDDPVTLIPFIEEWLNVRTNPR